MLKEFIFHTFYQKRSIRLKAPSNVIVKWRQKVGVFFQDRATPHTAARSMNYLRTHGLKTIFFPSSSPDLNPIEHGFSFLKRLLDRENTSSIPQLKKAILKHCKKLGKYYFLRLSHSMHRDLRRLWKTKVQWPSIDSTF